MTRELVAAAVLLAVCAGSALAYSRDHRRRRYAAGREAQPRSVPAFAAAYTWIRLSTPVAGLGALLSGHGAWLAVRPSAGVFWLGIALALGGFALFVHSRRMLGQQYAPCYDAYMPTQIVVDGVYGHVRHPIYTANVTLLLGLTLATGSAWLLLNTVLLAGFCAASATREEDALWASSPLYRSYVLVTGRFLPRLHRSSGFRDPGRAGYPLPHVRADGR